MLWPPEYTGEDTAGFPRLAGMAAEADEVATEQARKAKARLPGDPA